MIILIVTGIIVIPIILGLGALLIAGRQPNHFKYPALVFHEIPLIVSRRSLSEVAAEKFEKFAAGLAVQNYKTVLCKDFAATPAIKDRCVLLTFDDAFESIATTAAPILLKNNLIATIFAVAGFLGQRSQWDVYANRVHCSKAQIRQLAERGFEIGSHSLTHPNLCRLNDNDLWREVSDSRKILEDIIGKPVTSFSFPFGFCNARVWETVLKAGYTTATLYRGHAELSDPRLIPVYGVYQFDSVDAILSKIDCAKKFSPARAQSRIMAHFAKGSAVVKYRKEYKSKKR